MKKIYIKLTYSIVIILILGISIGYSAFNDRMLLESAVAEVRIEKDIRITKVGIEETTSDALSKYEDYNITNISSSITLPYETSSITYRIEITNLGNVEMGIKEIQNIPNNLTYELIDYNLGEKLCDNNKCNLGIKKEFLLKIKYKEYNPSQLEYNLKLDFDFRPFYKIKYNNLDNISNYPNEIIENSSLDIIFKNQNFTSLNVVMNNKKLINEKDYTFLNYNLKVPNVLGNIEITLINQPYMVKINDNEFFKEEKYLTKIQNVYFVDYIKENDYLVSYDISKDKNNSIIAWITEETANYYNLYIGANYKIKVEDLTGLFQNMTSLESVDFSNLSTDETISFKDMFNNCTNIKKLDLRTLETTKALTFEGMFNNCSLLEEIDFSNINLQNTSNISSMFANCKNLTNLQLGTESINSDIVFTNILKDVNENIIIKVKNNNIKNWILSLPPADRPTVLSDANIEIE